MILQVQDILKDAMGLIGVIAIDESPSTSEYTQVLRTLNVMVDRWSSQRLMLRSTVALSIPLVAGKATYTIGVSGCDVTAPKPIQMRTGYYRDVNNNDLPIEMIDIITYNSINDKMIASGPPMYGAYDPGDTQQIINKGTLSVYPIPDTVYYFNVEVDTYLTEFVNLSDTVTFEPAYYEALIYNLAVRLFRYYRDANVQIPQDIISVANISVNNLKTMNKFTVIAASDLPGKISSYNIYSDSN